MLKFIGACLVSGATITGIKAVGDYASTNDESLRAFWDSIPWWILTMGIPIGMVILLVVTLALLLCALSPLFVIVSLLTGDDNGE